MPGTIALPVNFAAVSIWQKLHDAQQDDFRSLKDCGVSANARILVLGGQTAATQTSLAAQEAIAQEKHQRADRLQRLKEAAEALAKRSGNE